MPYTGLWHMDVYILLQTNPEHGIHLVWVSLPSHSPDSCSALYSAHVVQHATAFTWPLSMVFWNPQIFKAKCKFSKRPFKGI